MRFVFQQLLKTTISTSRWLKPTELREIVQAEVEHFTAAEHSSIKWQTSQSLHKFKKQIITLVPWASSSPVQGVFIFFSTFQKQPWGSTKN